MVVKTCVARPSLIFFLPPPSQSHENYPTAPPLFSHGAGSLIAVHFRHANVEQCHIGLEGRCSLYGLHAVVGRLDLVAHHTQHHSEAIGGVAIVVCDQDAELCLATIWLAISSSLRARWGWPLHYGVAHDELTALAGAAVGLDGAAVQLHQAADQGQTDAQASLCPRP